MIELLKKTLFNEQYVVFYYLFIYMLNNVTQYYFDYFPKLLYALGYLWILIVFLYHFFGGSYFKKKEGVLSLVFLLINIICTFIYKANWRLSVFPDFALLVFFIPVCLCINIKKNELIRLLYLFMGVYFVFSSIGVLGEVLHLPYIHALMPDRGRGIYSDIAEAGIISYVMIILSVYFLRVKALKGDLKHLFADHINKMHLLNIIIHFSLLLISKGRTSFICLMLAMLVLGYYDLDQHFRNKANYRKIKRVFLLFAAIAIYFIGFSKYGPERNMYSLLHGENSLWNISTMTEEQFSELMVRFLSGRYNLWVGSIQTIAKSPIYGYGLKSCGFTYGFDPVIGPNSHNLILNTLLFSGVIGLISITGLLLYTFRKMNNGFAGAEYLPLKLFLYTYLLSSMLDTNVLYNGKTMNILFWVILAFGVNQSDYTERNRVEEPDMHAFIKADN